MANISETELQRRLKALERKPSSKESNYLSSIDPVAGSFTEGDTHYNATTNNLWLFSSGTWSIDASVLHVRYADAVTTNPPTLQTHVTNFSSDPLNPNGSLKLKGSIRIQWVRTKVSNVSLQCRWVSCNSICIPNM